MENNLHGIDIDPRAIQIAAAGLYVKAKSLSSAARPKKMNLVAPVFQLGNLPADDPAIVHLRHDLKRDVGIPEELTTRLLSGLAGVDYLGSLLKVDAAVEGALASVELEFQRERGQGSLFGDARFPTEQVKLTAGEAKATVLDKLEAFLGKHSGADDLGLRLDGEQLAAGVRFVRMVREGSYDVVVGNPPYQGLSKTASFEYVAKDYPRGKADLYAAFLERGLELARPGGISALLTMRGWMFLGQFAELRKHLLKTADLRLLGDVDRGAFEDVPDEVLATVMSLFRRGAPSEEAVALQPTPPEDRSRDGGRTNRKRAAVLAQVGRHEFDPRGFEVIEGEPIVYWWSREFLARYAGAEKLGDVSPAKFGLNTGNNGRFIRQWWESGRTNILCVPLTEPKPASCEKMWSWFLNGAAGASWIDAGDQVIRWMWNGLEVRILAEFLYGSYSRQSGTSVFTGIRASPS
ncbi:MAG: Eco57I restriction-modification methylase domain-containing protein [Myxococcales bacterium]|nr:Eco57I restriction-modification methylase domain-containing protein [Myxococcales bacterium]